MADAVNISHKIYNQMKDVVLNQKKYSAKMFAEQKNEILKQMEHNVFACFKKSEEFYSLLTKRCFYLEGIS